MAKTIIVINEVFGLAGDLFVTYASNAEGILSQGGVPVAVLETDEPLDVANKVALVEIPGWEVSQDGVEITFQRLAEGNSLEGATGIGLYSDPELVSFSVSITDGTFENGYLTEYLFGQLSRADPATGDVLVYFNSDTPITIPVEDSDSIDDIIGTIVAATPPTHSISIMPGAGILLITNLTPGANLIPISFDFGVTGLELTTISYVLGEGSEPEPEPEVFFGGGGANSGFSTFRGLNPKITNTTSSISIKFKR